MHASTMSFPSVLQELDSQRIAGTSLAIALHVAVALVLLMPVLQPAAPQADEPPLTLTVLPRFIPPPTPPPKHAPITRAATPAPPAAIVPVIPTPDRVVDPTPFGTLPFVAPVDIGDPLPIGPSFVDLATDAAPPPSYPTMALTRNQEGRVLLRVLVDEQGRPVEVSVEQSSGFRLLDESALKMVRARWHFVPAQRDGVAVSAYALVPIVFRIER